MRAPLDSLSVSREKLAFIVDSVSLSLVTLSPISSWVGFEVGLIQAELDRIELLDGEGQSEISESAFGVLLQTIRYRYYPIFMIFFVLAIIVSERDFAGMLIAERKARVYQRTDGGDGRSTKSGAETNPETEPKPETPKRTWNMVVPMMVLVFFSLYLLVKTGESDEKNQSIVDKIENANANEALLWGTMAAIICTLLFYLGQIVDNGSIVIPTGGILRKLFASRERSEEDVGTSSLLTIRDSVDSFLAGMARVFPAIIVLTLAWAAGSMVVAVGIDRLFTRWILGNISPEFLPTFSFIISALMAASTGTPDGTMSILFPSFLVPTYQSCKGDPRIFYSTVAGILSGVVAGVHASPISDTSVLGSLACGCDLFKHVGTQVPYTITCAIISILFGTVPIGYSAWPNFVSLILACFAMVAFLRLVCKHAIEPDGKYDFFTEQIVKYTGTADSPLNTLRQDTIKANSQKPTTPDEDTEIVFVPQEDDSSTYSITNNV
jgi:Na+/H+ antiporter NhaC